VSETFVSSGCFSGSALLAFSKYATIFIVDRNYKNSSETHEHGEFSNYFKGISGDNIGPSIG
jgi:hypothetical protein